MVGFDGYLMVRVKLIVEKIRKQTAETQDEFPETYPDKYLK